MKDITMLRRCIEIQDTLDKLSSLVDSDLFPQDGYIDLSSQISQVQKTFNYKVCRWFINWSEISKQNAASKTSQQ